MLIDTGPELSRQVVFDDVHAGLGNLSLNATDIDMQRPWGGFFVIDNQQTPLFIATYFPDVPQDDIYRYGNNLGPKILVVEPHKRLSWQYHNRRAELWRPAAGTAGYITSETDEQGDVSTLPQGELLQVGAGIRHRLIGLDRWVVVAEIWQHTDPASPSDEADIVRLEDDANRV